MKTLFDFGLSFIYFFVDLNKKQWAILVGIFVFVALLYINFFGYCFTSEKDIYLYRNKSINDIVYDLEYSKSIRYPKLLKFFVKLYGIDTVKQGYYHIASEVTMMEFLKKMRLSEQDQLKITLSTATYIEDIALKLSEKLPMDASDFMKFIKNPENQKKYGFSEQKALCFVLPETHFVYWKNDLHQVFQRFEKFNHKFWNKSRLEKCQDMRMTKEEVYILASLVQKEYAKKEERATIAGVIVNRINQNIKLQIDATAKFAAKDFGAKRVLNKHTSIPSPDNTYHVFGLPSRPICMPELSTIDAVLNYEIHDYLFYCANPKLNGYHIFSKTLEEHNAVAKHYQQRLNQLNIKK